MIVVAFVSIVWHRRHSVFNFNYGNITLAVVQSISTALCVIRAAGWQMCAAVIVLHFAAYLDATRCCLLPALPTLRVATRCCLLPALHSQCVATRSPRAAPRCLRAAPRCLRAAPRSRCAAPRSLPQLIKQRGPRNELDCIPVGNPAQDRAFQ